MRMVRVREKVFRNSSGFRFNVSFVDCTSVFVKGEANSPLPFWPIISKLHYPPPPLLGGEFDPCLDGVGNLI